MLKSLRDAIVKVFGGDNRNALAKAVGEDIGQFAEQILAEVDKAIEVYQSITPGSDVESNTEYSLEEVMVDGQKATLSEDGTHITLANGDVIPAISNPVFDQEDIQDNSNLVRKIIKEELKKYKGKVLTIGTDENSRDITVHNEFASEYTYAEWKKGKLGKGKKLVKMNIATELEEMVRNAKFFNHEPNTDFKKHPYTTRGWDYYSTDIAIKADANNYKIWSGYLNISMEKNNIDYLYDITNLKELSNNAPSTSNTDSTAPVGASIPPSTGDINKNNKVNKVTNPVGIEFDSATDSAYPTEFSYESWNRSDYISERNKAAQELAKALGVSVKKATKYIDDVNSVNSVAKMIADDRARLDFDADEFNSSVVSNAEYGASIDFSTICKKRLLYTGTLQAIQKQIGNRVITMEDYLAIRNAMLEDGLELNYTPFLAGPSSIISCVL